jgi:hypothetical protein
MGKEVHNGSVWDAINKCKVDSNSNKSKNILDRTNESKNNQHLHPVAIHMLLKPVKAS